MNGVADALGAALRGRLLDRLRLIERAQALETHPVAPVKTARQRDDAEALLRQCLRALGDHESFALAGRVLAGDLVVTGGVAEWTALQELAQAGLVSWDLGSGTVEATALLRELYTPLVAALAEAAQQ